MELGDDWAVAEAHSNAAFLDLGESSWSAAADQLEQSLAIHHQLGDDEASTAILYNNLAAVARHQGDLGRAVALFERSRALERRTGRTSAIIEYNLGDCALLERQLPRAAEHFAEALRIGSDSGEQRGIEAGLIGLVRLAAAVGQLELATWLMGAAEALRERARLSLTPKCSAHMEEVVGAGRATLGEAASVPRSPVAGWLRWPSSRPRRWARWSPYTRRQRPGPSPERATPRLWRSDDLLPASVKMHQHDRD